MTEENSPEEEESGAADEAPEAAAEKSPGEDAKSEEESAEGPAGGGETASAESPAEGGAEASGGERDKAAEKPAEEPEDPLETRQGVRAVRAFLGDEVEEVGAFNDLPDEVYMVVPAGRLRALCDFLKSEQGFDYLSDLCGVHFAGRDRPFEVVYQLFSIRRSERLRLKVRLKEGEAAPTVSTVWKTADWLEREAYDMFGIEFEGHPDLRRILLPDDWEGFPLRKEYPVRGDGFGLKWVERQIPKASRPSKERM